VGGHGAEGVSPRAEFGGEGRDRLHGTLHNREGGIDCPGLDNREATAAWIWDHQIAAIAADNPALEALRIDPAVGFQHRRLMPLQGMPIGEFWLLEDLAAACAEVTKFQKRLL